MQMRLMGSNSLAGSPETRSRYNKLAASYNPAKYWAIHDWNAQVAAVRGRAAQRRAAKLRAKDLAKKRAEAAAKGIILLEEQAQLEQPETSAKIEGEGNESVKLMGTKMDLDVTSASTSTDTDGQHLPPQNHYEGLNSAKQLSESLSQFLDRLPPSITKISDAGPWIWIANPSPRDRHSSDPESGDGNIGTFKQLGLRLLEGYMSHKQDVETQNPGKAAGSITRMLRNERVKLEMDIRDLAKTQGVTAGKWMLFPSASDVDRVWAIVAKGVWENQLGSAAKVATAIEDAAPSSAESSEANDNGMSTTRKDRDRSQRLICIYTADFSDQADVLRVLRAIKDLGLLLDDHGTAASPGPAMRTIYYKCDAYTYLDISSGNEYKLKASMYSSRELMPGLYKNG